jgi:very-short-patch-repair endonuclease
MKKSRKKVTITCLECGEVINGGSHMSYHVKNVHNYSSYDEYKLKYNLIKSDQQLLNEGAVKCKICGIISHDLTSHITRIHKMCVKDYKEKYGEIRSKKYLKNQSERISGDKNPAFNHGGKLSPFSDNFIYADKINKEELIKKVSESNKTNGNNSTTLSYWIKRGFTEEESRKKISEKQQTFTLQKCIEKYGEEVGIDRWVDRQNKWQDSFKKSRKNGFSKISQELFWKIYQNLNTNKKLVYFAELNENKNPDFSGNNHEYKLRLKTKVVLPDFIDFSTNKIIEFDGTYWHGKHLINQPNKMREEERDRHITEGGFKVLHIKEEDYRNNPENVIKCCLEFLNG